MAVKKALLATKVAVFVVLLAMASIANARSSSDLYTLLASLNQPSLPQDVRNYYKIERASSRDMMINKAEKEKSMEEIAVMLNTALEGIAADYNGGNSKYALGKCPPDCINCGCATAPFVIICKCGKPIDD